MKIKTSLCALLALILLLSSLPLSGCAAGTGGSDTTASAGELPTSPESTAPVETAHVHEYTESFVAPTLTEQGYQLFTCSCGDSYTGTYTGITGEKYTAFPKYKILFVGNSYTYYNDMADVILAAIVRGQGHTFAVTTITKGSWTLTKDCSPTDELGKQIASVLKSTVKYDYVFLQEQSTTPAAKPAEFYSAVRTLDARFKEKGSQIVLYQTWGAKKGCSDLSSKNWTDQQMYQLTMASYEAIAEELNAPLAPAGRAMMDVYNNHPEINVYMSDGKHPSAAGSYLIALVHYATLYGLSPIGVSYTLKSYKDEKGNAVTLNETQTKILQEAAYNAVFGESTVTEKYKTSSIGVGSPAQK